MDTIRASQPSVATCGQSGAAPVMAGRVKPALRFDGVARTSALGRIATELLAGWADLAFADSEPPTVRSWRREVRGTALQWWSDASRPNGRPVSESFSARVHPTNPARIPVSPKGGRYDTGAEAGPGTGALETTVDLGRHATGPGGRSWCIVDAAGIPLLQPFHALSVCHTEPYVASLNLIESEDGGATWQLLANAHVSSARRYPELLGILGRTAMRLLRMALADGGASRRPWAPEPPRPGPTQSLWGARRASHAAWLRARVGGEIYGVATLERRPEEFLQDQCCPAAQWLQIPPSQGFIADPFFWPGQPGVLLCETYLHRTGLGQLTALSIDTGQIVGSEALPLGLECHLSYPSTWAEDGRVFCLPEMAASRRQMLYELKRGEAPVPLCVVSEDVGMADPTLMKVNGLYWIAYTDTDIGTYDNLCLLHAPRLEGPWSPHGNNPVKIDARSSRPGGTPFQVGDALYRPAQDCSREYGGALTINQVTLCTPDGYHEAPVATLRPDPKGAFPDGLHTLSFGDGLAVIDGKRNSYHPAILTHKLGRRLLRLPKRLLARRP